MDNDEAHEFQQIGNLATKIVASQPSKASSRQLSTGSQPSSPTTGVPSQVPVAASWTGQRLGAIACAPSQLPAAATAADADRVVKAWLKSTLAWPQSLSDQGVVYGEDGQFEATLTGCRLPNELRPHERDAAEAALAELVVWCEPAPNAVLLAELAKMRVALAHRNAETHEERTVAIVFADDCGEYPADVIREACRDWRRTEKWFPTPAELRARCARLARQRFLWRDTLNRAIWTA